MCIRDRHAHAGRVTITAGSDGDWLRLAISDDGIGGADPAGWGLRGLRDRVAALGGTLEVESPGGGGTTVRAVIPVRPAGAGRAEAGASLPAAPTAARGSGPG